MWGIVLFFFLINLDVNPHIKWDIETKHKYKGGLEALFLLLQEKFMSVQNKRALNLFLFPSKIQWSKKIIKENEKRKKKYENRTQNLQL